jgi:hypothetical protein
MGVAIRVSGGISLGTKRITAAMEPRWRMALTRKRPTPASGKPRLSSPSSSSSSMRSGGSTSASRLRGASTGRVWLLMGTHWPLILISAGEWPDKYTSEAFLSLIKRRMRSIVPIVPLVAIVLPLVVS